MCTASNKGGWGRAGFSLVELLAVIGIIGIMAAAGLPALKGITGSTGRTGAINGLMSALDQTRSAAILSGANAYVVFPDQAFSTLPATASFNPSNYVYRSYAIFRDPNPDLEGTNTNTIQIGKWESLPQGIALVSTRVTALPTNRLFISLPGSTVFQARTLRSVGFNSSGGLLDPVATNGITVYEGYWNGSQGVPARTNNQIVDRITLNRFTGRAFLSIATNTGSY